MPIDTLTTGAAFASLAALFGWVIRYIIKGAEDDRKNYFESLKRLNESVEKHDFHAMTRHQQVTKVLGQIVTRIEKCNGVIKK